MVELKRYEEAAQANSKATELAPDNSAAWQNLGVALQNLESYEEAAQAYSKVTELAPDNADGWQGKAEALQGLEDFQGAHDAYSRATEIEPDRVSLMTGTGRALLGLSLYERATEILQRAVTVRSDDAETWEELGNAYAAMERYRPAQRAYRRSIELEPQSSTALVAMSVALMKLGENEEALDALRRYGKALGDPMIAYNRGVALHGLGRTEEALAAWDEAATAKPPIKQARELVESLRTKPVATPGSWWDYWFGLGVRWHRRLLGAVLLVILSGFLILPLLTTESIGWLDTEQEWTDLVLPVAVLTALLVLPTVRRLSVGSLEIEPALSSGEEKHRVPLEIPNLEPALSPSDIRIPTRQHPQPKL